MGVIKGRFEVLHADRGDGLKPATTIRPSLGATRCASSSCRRRVGASDFSGAWPPQRDGIRGCRYGRLGRGLGPVVNNGQKQAVKPQRGRVLGATHHDADQRLRSTRRAHEEVRRPNRSVTRCLNIVVAGSTRKRR